MDPATTPPSESHSRLAHSNASQVPLSPRSPTNGGVNIFEGIITRPSLRQRFQIWLHSNKREIGEAPGYRASLLAIVKTSWLNVLLVFIPISWAFNFALPNSDTLIFVFSFLAIIPLASLLAFATDELSMRLGQTLAGLLNATLGNTVELIVSIIALAKCELDIVQASLVGSILSNLLLVLGMCFFAGGTRFSEQGFGIGATQLNSSLMTLSVIGLLLPGAFHLAVQPSPDAPTEDPLTNPKEGSDILSVSRGTAVILLWIYGSYMFFMMFSHKSMYSDGHSDVQKSIKYDPSQAVHFSNPLRRRRGTPSGSIKKQSSEPDHETGQVIPAEPAISGEPSHLADPEIGEKNEEEEEVERPSMNIPVTIGLLIVVTVFVGVTAEWLVDSINGLTEKGAISKTFVGLILLPIVGNAAEHVTAVTVSVKDKLTLSLGVAVGSSIQIALFVIPLDVILAWIMDKPLTMLFDPYASIVLFLAVLTVNYVVQDGKSNWLEGMILMCLYVVVATSFWFYPGVNPADALLKCT